MDSFTIPTIGYYLDQVDPVIFDRVIKFEREDTIIKRDISREKIPYVRNGDLLELGINDIGRYNLYPIQNSRLIKPNVVFYFYKDLPNETMEYSIGGDITKLKIFAPESQIVIIRFTQGKVVEKIYKYESVPVVQFLYDENDKPLENQDSKNLLMEIVRANIYE